MYIIYVQKTRFDASENVRVFDLEDKRRWGAKTIGKDTNHVIKYIKDGNKWECTCGDYLHRHVVCKHIVAVIKEHVKNVEFKIMEVENAPG